MLLNDSCKMKSFNIVLHKRYTKEEICSGTMGTLKKVNSCPENYPTFLDRNKTMDCSSYPQCKGQGLFYHCVKFENGLAEVCAPRSVITGECCALYDEGIGRVIEDYSRPCPDCPFQYSSDAFLKNSPCVKTTETKPSNQHLKETTTVSSKVYLIEGNSLTNASKMSFVGSAKIIIMPCKRKMRRGLRNAECKSSSNHDSTDEGNIQLQGSNSEKKFQHAEQQPKTISDAFKHVLTIATVVVFIIILFATICQYKRKRIKKWLTSERVLIIKNKNEKIRTKPPETKRLQYFDKKKSPALSEDESTEFHISSGTCREEKTLYKI